MYKGTGSSSISCVTALTLGHEQHRLRDFLAHEIRDERITNKNHVVLKSDSGRGSYLSCWDVLRYQHYVTDNSKFDLHQPTFCWPLTTLM